MRTMEWRILFLGPVGAGKTAAIKTISDVEVVGTEARASDETAQLKHSTTVAMDMGVMKLGEAGRVVLYGAPGQERFDFMWEILLRQTRGIVILVDQRAEDPLAILGNYLAALRRYVVGALPPVVVGVTHTDLAPTATLDAYRDYLQRHAADLGGARVPVFRTDARHPRDVRNLLLALTAMLEFDERIGPLAERPKAASPGRAIGARLALA